MKRYGIERDKAHDQWAVIDLDALAVVGEFDRLEEAEHWALGEGQLEEVER